MVSSDSSNSNSSNNITDSKKLQVFRQQASAVSRALWPSNLHRSQVIGKAAQKRRRGALSTMYLSRTENVPASVPVLLVITSTIVGGSIVTALLLHLWYVLLFPTLILTLTTLVIMPPLLRKLNHTPNRTKPIFPTIQSTPRYYKSSPGIPAVRRAPETPMPKTPLVRELETFDLSETGVEHFLDVNSGSGMRERASLTNK